MRRVLALSCAAVAAAASREVHKLRAAQSACTLNRTRGPEPTKRFVVFTKQRSGSRWFVNALALRSNGTFQTHIPEIEFRGFGMREIKRAKGAYAACHSRSPSKRCSCAMRRFFHAHAHNCVEIKFYAMALVLNRRVNLHAIDATPARWRGDAGSSPLDGASTAASSPRNDLVKSCRMHPTHRLIFTQAHSGPGYQDERNRTAISRVGGCPAKETKECHVGYKWMVDTADTGHRRGNHHAIPYKYDKKRPPEFTAVAASICEMRIPYIFMWRKNTLRRMISNAANQHTTKRAIRKHIDPHAHAATSRDAQKLARYRPKLNTRNLLIDLNQAQIEQQDAAWKTTRNVVRLFEYHCGSDAPRRQYWYEDLIDTSPKSTVAWAKVLYHLGAWPRVDVERVKRLKRAEAKGAGLVTSFRNAHAPQVMIHGSKPISATIGNYNAVYRVLKGTPHEWMLERHLEPKSGR